MGRLQRTLPALVALGTVVLVAESAIAQYDTAWVRRHEGPGASIEEAHCVRLDQDGNVYVTGRGSSVSFNSDITTLKYDNDGNLLWEAYYDGPAQSLDIGGTIIIDETSGIYVVGGSEGLGTDEDITLLKYTPDGDTIWTRRYNGAADSRDAAGGIAMDSAGCIYVTGMSLGLAPSWECITLKYDSAGELLWEKRYTVPDSGWTKGTLIQVDGQGDLYVAGWTEVSESGVDVDIIVLKYDSTGTLLWDRRYNGAASLKDYAAAMTFDAAMNLYVVGTVGKEFGGSAIVILKYSPDGTLLMEHLYEGHLVDIARARDIHLDRDGNIYVSGSTLVTRTNEDILTLKFAPDGTLLWRRLYDGPAEYSDWSAGMMGDSLGYSIIVGTSFGGGHDNSDRDVVMLKYNAEGDLLWERRYNSPADDRDEPGSGTTDEEGNVYITGWSIGPTGSWDYLTIKYSPCDVPPTPGAPVTSDSAPCWDSAYTVTWNSVADVSEYELLENGVLVYSGANTSVSMSHAEGTFEYEVRARDQCGPSMDNPVGALTTIAPRPEIAGPPVASDSIPCPDGAYTIAWTSVAGGAYTYELFESGASIYLGSDTSVSLSHVSGAYSYYVVPHDGICGTGIASPVGANVTIADCPYQSDFDEEGFVTSIDLASLIDVLFGEGTDPQDPQCPTTRGDFDCDGFTTALDMSGLIDHLFASGEGPCDPCAK
jgi:uncharacterized delta-60 repeat protein